MSFFAGASNIKIVGGEFNDIKGNYTLFDHSRHETNIDSSNVYNNNIIDSYNDNSRRISGRYPRSRLLEGGNDRSQASSTSANRGEEDPTDSPSPHHTRFPPPQISSAGGSVTNINAFNTKNNRINDVFNDNSQTHYYGRGPPIKQGRDFGRKSIHEEEEGSGPYMTVDSPRIQNMSEDMNRTFTKLMKYTLAQVQSDMPGNSNENDDSDGADSTSLHSARTEDSIVPGMNMLSIKNGHLSPPAPFSRNKSDPQIAMQPTTHQVSRQIGPPNPSSLSPYNNTLQSHSNPSLAPHMKEKSMVDFLAQPAAVEQTDIYASNDPNKPPFVATSGFNFPPSSSGGPIFRKIDGDYVKHDTTEHITNINSFNREKNTIRNAFNNNSVVITESLEKRKKKKKKVENTVDNDNSSVDSLEKREKEEKVENTIESDNSSVGFTEKRKKKKKMEKIIETDNSSVDSSEKHKKGEDIEITIESDHSSGGSPEKRKKGKKKESTIDSDNSSVGFTEKQKKGKKVDKMIDNNSSAVDSSEPQKKGNKTENTIPNDTSVVDSTEKQKKPKKRTKFLEFFMKK